MSTGYFMYPTVFGEQIVFCSEDDLWMVPLNGGIARRLTAGLGNLSRPLFSPDGKWLAYSSGEEGTQEISIIAAQGGESRRLTYSGGLVSNPSCWTSPTQLVFATDLDNPHRITELYSIDIEGGLPKSLNLGPSTNLSVAKDGFVVLERNAWRSDPAYWKRYRGGTAGKFWIAQNMDADFQPILDLNSNLSRPLWVNDRLYFLSDHEGIGNIFSCSKGGQDIQRHSKHSEFYARNPNTDGKNIVYHLGGDIYRLDLKTQITSKVQIEYLSQRTQRQRKFVSASRYLDDLAIHPQGHKVSISTRGQVFEFGPWEGPVHKHGNHSSTRYRFGEWLFDSERTVVVSDEGGEERLEIHSPKSQQPEACFAGPIGRVTGLKPSPTENKVAITNHRNELLLIDLEQMTSQVIAKNEFDEVESFSWSPCGQRIAFSKNISRQQKHLKIYDLLTQKSYDATKPFMSDFSPDWSPDGQYLYFLSIRHFDAVADSVEFGYGFPTSVVPCLITLRKDITSPFLRQPMAPQEETQKTGAPNERKPIQIDYEDLPQRIQAFPVPHGKYTKLRAVEKKVLWQKEPIIGLKNANWFPEEPSASGVLESFDFETNQAETWMSGLSNFRISGNGKMVLLRSGNQLRVISSQVKPDEKAPKEFSNKSGWINLDRVKVLIEPPQEWTQMLKEVWRLQRDHFWVENMSSIDWSAAYDRYAQLVSRVNTRKEFSDLIWELQGELGTSHSYDMGGDYRVSPQYKVGFLGADFEYEIVSEGYQIKQVLQSDLWEKETASPLRAPGVNLSEGDILLAINGLRLDRLMTPPRALLNLAGQELELLVQLKNEKTPKCFVVKALKEVRATRYRNWVEGNRNYVHEKSKGRLGYIHLPDMSPSGYGEFTRSYLQECNQEGLIVDIRFNGGGHVSSLILQRLAQKPLGLSQSRWFGTHSYPKQVPLGCLVGITNEFAGSDGDIFSHSFKLMKLGPLIGRRTWGGVIGIWPRHNLVDGSVTTQPEFSYWFSDVEWAVENYGTEPTIEMDNPPHSYRKKEDPQLDRGIKEALLLLEKQPSFAPQLKNFPDLRSPRLMASQ
ncbi:MAG: PDZ domain-containing protein [Bdellovibrionaceae bacterium]|nr:PDZ domain-containing protein [Pseudobdellovibrionaceae bacterium]